MKGFLMDMKWLDKINSKEKRLIGVIIILVFVWIIYTGIIEPLYLKWIRIGKDIEISKIELIKAKKILNQKKDVSSKYTKYLKRFKAKERDEEEMALILNEIESQARKASLKIINMKPRRVQKNASHRMFYVDIDAQASMRNTMKFIKGLRNSKLALCVEELTLNSRTGDPSILSGSIAVSRLGVTE